MRLNPQLLRMLTVIICTGFAAIGSGIMGLSDTRPLSPTRNRNVLSVAGGCWVADDDEECPTGDNMTCHDIYHCQGADDTCDEIWSAYRAPLTPPSIPGITTGDGPRAYAPIS